MNQKTAKNEQPIAIALFASYGGLSVDFEQAGFNVVASVEIDPMHSVVHEYNFLYSTVICTNVKAIFGSNIRKRANWGNQNIDVVVGGTPCQGFSLIGKHSASSTGYAVNHSSFTHENSGGWKIFNMKYSMSREPYVFETIQRTGEYNGENL